VEVLGGNGWCSFGVGVLVGFIGWGRVGWVCGRLIGNRIFGEFWWGWTKVGFDW